MADTLKLNCNVSAFAFIFSQISLRLKCVKFVLYYKLFRSLTFYSPFFVIFDSDHF